MRFVFLTLPIYMPWSLVSTQLEFPSCATYSDARTRHTYLTANCERRGKFLVGIFFLYSIVFLLERGTLVLRLFWGLFQHGAEGNPLVFGCKLVSQS